MELKDLKKLLSNEHVKIILDEMSKLNNEDFSLFLQFFKETGNIAVNLVEILFPWFFKGGKNDESGKN